MELERKKGNKFVIEILATNHRQRK